MGNFAKSHANPLEYVSIVPDTKPHIFIKDDGICTRECENKPCTYYCPTRVFYWGDNSIKIQYKRCIECGGCPYGCPYENILWQFPRGGYGVVY